MHSEPTTKKNTPKMKNNPLEEMALQTKAYVDAKTEEIKLKATEGLSQALAKLLSMLLIIAVLIIILALLAYALLHWLNTAIGDPWGTLIVCAVFGVLLIVLLARREKMFLNSFVKLFINVFFEKEEEVEDELQ